jgi:hypothetical protein
MLVSFLENYFANKNEGITKWTHRSEIFPMLYRLLQRLDIIFKK